AAIVVHTKELLYQWRDRAAEFLGLAEDRIGQVGDGRCEIGPELTVCLVHSLYTRAQDLCPRIGHLVVDECHHAPSRTFTQAISAFDCRYMLGLSATPFRRDGLTSLIHFFVGELVCEIHPQELQDRGQILSARLCVRPTGFEYPYDDDYPQMVAALCADPARSQAIARDVAEWAAQGLGPALVVSDRKAHCLDLAVRIRELGARTAVLTGDVPGPERRECVAAANSGGVDVLVATLQLVGEGFDCPGLSALFLATPMKFSGRVLQVVGRILRTARGKGPATVFDYVDAHGVLKASFAARRRAYRQLGLTEDPSGQEGPGRKIWL
ncbi:MAG: DEAD/DEAH box helicase, partial [Pseudomonadota bacterium]